MSLARFRTAQDSTPAGFATALAELRAGRKTSHWIWYIFPQLAGLGRSSTAQFYALCDLAEAVAFLRDPVLSRRLAEITATVAMQLERGVRLEDLMGGTIDAAKLVSSLTLFELALQKVDRADAPPGGGSLAADCTAVLNLAERQGYPRCCYTVEHAV